MNTDAVLIMTEWPMIKEYEMELANAEKKQGKKHKGKEVIVTDNKKKNQEEFELMKKKMKSILIGSVVTIVLAIAGTIAYKCFK